MFAMAYLSALMLILFIKKFITPSAGIKSTLPALKTPPAEVKSTLPAAKTPLAEVKSTPTGLKIPFPVGIGPLQLIWFIPKRDSVTPSLSSAVAWGRSVFGCSARRARGQMRKQALTCSETDGLKVCGYKRQFMLQARVRRVEQRYL